MPQVSNFSLMNFQQNQLNLLRIQFSRMKHPPTNCPFTLPFFEHLSFPVTLSARFSRSLLEKNKAEPKPETAAHTLCTPVALQSRAPIPSPEKAAGYLWDSKTLDQDVGPPVPVAHLAIVMGKASRLLQNSFQRYRVPGYQQHILVTQRSCFHRMANLSLKQLVLTQLVFFFLTINSNCIINAAQVKFHSKIFKLQRKRGFSRLKHKLLDCGLGRSQILEVWARLPLVSVSHLSSKQSVGNLGLTAPSCAVLQTGLQGMMLA